MANHRSSRPCEGCLRATLAPGLRTQELTVTRIAEAPWTVSGADSALTQSHCFRHVTADVSLLAPAARAPPLPTSAFLQPASCFPQRSCLSLSSVPPSLRLSISPSLCPSVALSVPSSARPSISPLRPTLPPPPPPHHRRSTTPRRTCTCWSLIPALLRCAARPSTASTTGTPCACQPSSPAHATWWWPTHRTWYRALTHSLACSLTHSLTHSLAHSLNQSITHSLTHSLDHSLTHTCSLTHLLTHSMVSLCV